MAASSEWHLHWFAVASFLSTTASMTGIPTVATLAAKPSPECESHRRVLKDATLTQTPLLIGLPFEARIGLFARAHKAIKSNEQAEVISRVRAVRLLDREFVSAVILQHVLNKFS